MPGAQAQPRISEESLSEESDDVHLCVWASPFLSGWVLPQEAASPQKRGRAYSVCFVCVEFAHFVQKAFAHFPGTLHSAFRITLRELSGVPCSKLGLLNLLRLIARVRFGRIIIWKDWVSQPAGLDWHFGSRPG